MCLQRLLVGAAVFWGTEGVQQQTEAPQPERFTETPCEDDDLNVGVRVVAAEQFGPYLTELPVAARLWLFIAEQRASYQTFQAPLVGVERKPVRWKLSTQGRSATGRHPCH